MSLQDFDNFKQHLQEWMEAHPEEYDRFEEEMNLKDNAGYQKILTSAIAIAPKYESIVRKRTNQSPTNDISDIETLFTENKLAENIIGEIENTSEGSIIPAMFCWLYFGQSFERMVERGEEMRKNKKTTYLEKFFIAQTIKMLISKSKSLGLRTKEDWGEHHKLMKMADNRGVVDQIIQEAFDEKKEIGRKISRQTVPESYLIQVGTILKSKNSQHDIACLKIALEEMSIVNTGGVKAFRDFLEKRYGGNIHIISERGIQEAYKVLNEFVGEGKLIRDLKENRTYIDEIKKLLSD